MYSLEYTEQALKSVKFHGVDWQICPKTLFLLLNRIENFLPDRAYYSNQIRIIQLTGK